MGLDIYAGPLCRYYTRSWLTVVQQWGESHGVPVRIITPNAGRGSLWRKAFEAIKRKFSPSPVSRVESWRARLAAECGFGERAPWNWPESLDGEYETDKPGFDGYGAVQLWVAYAARPGAARPAGLSREWHEDRVYIEVSEAPFGFDHIMLPELWLPVPFEKVFKATEPNGACPKIGSVFVLRDQLRHLNGLTWKAGEDSVRDWRKGEFDPENLESMARWGFSILFNLAEFAAERRLPIRLDY